MTLRKVRIKTSIGNIFCDEVITEEDCYNCVINHAIALVIDKRKYNLIETGLTGALDYTHILK